jgi:sulfatase modifying factor 1
MSIGMRTLIPVVAVAFAAFTLAPQSQAQPLVNVDTVMVGDAGNAADSTGYGAVTDVFAVGKYEVTSGQYSTFLNSVASVTGDSYIVNLWNANMATDLNIAGISRSGSGTLASPYSYSVIGSGSRPIAYVSWFDAARFANWVNNGATNGASTETGAYTLNGATSGIINKNANASWWIPTGDEWIKAAYYKGGSTNAGYWVYPTASNTAPSAEANPPGSGNSANYGDVRPAGDKLTDVGSYITSESSYGTFDQGGNLSEWADGAYLPGFRSIHGGAYASPSEAGLTQTSISLNGPDGEFNGVGFRVATVPEPSTYALLAMSAAGILWLARRRR